MNNTKIIGVVVVLIIIIGILAVLYSGEKESVSTETVQELGENEIEITESMDNVMDDGESEEVMKDEMGETEQSPGTYELYSPEKVTMAKDNKIVLFFKASWCPSCRALDSDVKKNVAAIPDGVTILEIDYDSATELRQKYGVTSQHTLVQVDVDGNAITKWSGGNSLESVLANLE